MNESNTGMNEEQVAFIFEAIQKGMSLSDMCNMRTEDLENLYALAYNLYTSCNYTDAEVVFQSLCLYNHKDVRFWMGLAGCRQAKGDMKGAIDAYAMAGSAGLLKDPAPFLYAAKCYIQLGEKENAIAALKGLLSLGDETIPAHASCHEKAKALLTLLEN